MTDSQWERTRALFDEAAELPPHERQAFLEAACPDDPALRVEVLDLLSMPDDADADAPIRDAVARIAEVVGGEEGLQVDQSIGPYRLDRELAHGGMGTVYLAHRDDDEFQRAVAIKVIRGWADDEMIRRFRIERQILASLDHPNIGRLIDGGATSSGLPYLVMEYVAGPPLGEYCDEHRLPVDERIRLVVTLCRAVHYAHERGVVHRDLKPSNVLVNADGVPKLLDFGIARLFKDSEIDAGTVAVTMTSARRMTPEYASPEQALGAPVTTASDVYVLGLLLYELLTGVRPQRSTTGRLEDITRAVAEVMPPRPSDAITRARREQETARRTKPSQPVALALAETCVARQTTPDRLARQLSGDLDRIILKAISKEPDRRYSSAASLADDLQRYLDGEPVHARSASITYIARRRVIRHWKLASAAAAVVALIGVQTVFWFAQRAEQAAEVEAAQRFGRQVERVGLDLRIERGLPLHDTRPAKRRVRARIDHVQQQMAASGRLAQGPGHYAMGLGYLALGENDRARASLERAWDEGYRIPEVSTSLGLALGRLYREALLEIDSVGNPAQREGRRAIVQASLRDPALRFLRMGDADPDFAVYTASLTDFFEGNLEGAMEKAQTARTQIGWLHETLLLEGDVSLDRGVAASARGDYDGARQELARAADQYLQAVRVAESDPVPYTRLCALGAIRMGLDLDTGGGLESDVIAALDYCHKASEADPDLAQPYVDLARTYWNLATYQRRNGRSPLVTLALAVDSAQAAIARDPENAKAYQHLGTALQQRGAHEFDTGADPRASLREAIAAYDKALALGLDDASLHNSLANTYAYDGDWDRQRGMDPRESYQKAIAEYRAAGEREPGNALPYGNMGITFKDLAMYDDANGRDPMPLLRDSIDAYDEALRRNPNHAPTHNNKAQSWYRVGLTQFGRGEDPTDALAEADASVNRAIEVNPAYATPYVNRAEVGLARAAFLKAQGLGPTDVLAGARASLRRALEINPGNRAQFYAHSARVELSEAQWRLAKGEDVGAFIADARGFAVRMQQVNAGDPDAWELLAKAGMLEARARARMGLSPTAALNSAWLALDKALASSPDAPWYLQTSLDLTLCQLEVGQPSPETARAAMVVALERADRALARTPGNLRLQALAAVIRARSAVAQGDNATAVEARASLAAAVKANPYLTREFDAYLSK